MTIHKRDTPEGNLELFVQEPGLMRYRYSCPYCGSDKFQLIGEDKILCETCKAKIKNLEIK